MFNFNYQSRGVECLQIVYFTQMGLLKGMSILFNWNIGKKGKKPKTVLRDSYLMVIFKKNCNSNLI